MNVHSSLIVIFCFCLPEDCLFHNSYGDLRLVTINNHGYYYYLFSDEYPVEYGGVFNSGQCK